jgi:hypothetical protein
VKDICLRKKQFNMEATKALLCGEKRRHNLNSFLPPQAQYDVFSYPQIIGPVEG